MGFANVLSGGGSWFTLAVTVPFGLAAVRSRLRPLRWQRWASSSPACTCTCSIGCSCARAG